MADSGVALYRFRHGLFPSYLLQRPEAVERRRRGERGAGGVRAQRRARRAVTLVRHATGRRQGAGASGGGSSMLTTCRCIFQTPSTSLERAIQLPWINVEPSVAKTTYVPIE